MPSGSDALPPPSTILDKPVKSDDAEQRSFNSVRLLIQAMVLMTRPNTNLYDMLQVVSSFFTDCEKAHREVCTCSVSMQKQLDDCNAKLLTQSEVQNAEILKLQDALEQSKLKAEFYQQQAEKAEMIQPHRRRRTVQSDDKLQLSPELLSHREDIAHRDAEIQRLQLQVLDVSAELCETRISALEQHVDLFYTYDPAAELDDEWEDLYVPPRHTGFYRWTNNLIARLNRALYNSRAEMRKCRIEAQDKASRAASAQKQLLATQERLSIVEAQFRSLHFSPRSCPR